MELNNTKDFEFVEQAESEQRILGELHERINCISLEMQQLTGRVQQLKEVGTSSASSRVDRQVALLIRL